MTMTANEMHELTKNLDTKNAKMRVLRAAGVSRSEIARFLGVTYQRVRSAEKEDARRGAVPPAAPQNPHTGLSDVAQPRFRSGSSGIVHIDVNTEGTLPIPRAVLAANGFPNGEAVTVIPDGEGRLRLLSAMESIREAQAIVARHTRPGVSLVDELFKMRREEAEQEEREYRETQDRLRRK
jgi:hypothetical protein